MWSLICQWAGFRRPWCGTGRGTDYGWTHGKAAYFLIGFSALISDERWPQAVQILKSGAQTLGANQFGITKDNPGDHDVYVQGPDGIQFQLSSQKAAALMERSDCRISQADQLTSPTTPS